MEELLKKNDDITLEITGVTSEGSGVGRFSGFAVFVPFALAGETVEAHIIKVTPSYAVGKLTKIIVPSPFRVEPPCPVFGKCGGCVLQNMSYPAQLEYKRQQVVDALERIGGFKGIEVNPTVGAEKVERYRNKGSFPFAMQDGEPVWGLYAQRSHRLIETPDCIIENETAINAANAVKLWAKKYSVPAYDENSCRGVLRHVVTRSQTGGATVCVRKSVTQ